MSGRSDILGARLAVLVVGPGVAGKEDWAVLAGVVRERAGHLVLARASGEFAIRDEWVAGIRAADAEAQQALSGADYVLQLAVGADGVSADQLEAAGLPWPPR